MSQAGSQSLFDDRSVGPCEVVVNEIRYVREATLFAAMAEIERLTRAITHVIYDSPGTPGSVKSYLSRALTSDRARAVAAVVAERDEAREKCEIARKSAALNAEEARVVRERADELEVKLDDEIAAHGETEAERDALRAALERIAADPPPLFGGSGLSRPTQMPIYSETLRSIARRVLAGEAAPPPVQAARHSGLAAAEERHGDEHNLGASTARSSEGNHEEAE